MSTETVTAQRLKRIPLFHGLTDAECLELYRAGKIQEFDPGQHVLEEGETNQNLWILLEGTCDVLKKHDGDAPVLLATLEPNANFGEMSFFQKAPHSASVQAHSHVRLLRIDRKPFDELIKLDSVLGAKLAINTVAILADRMRSISDRFADVIASKPKPQKPSDMSRLRETLFDSWQL